MDARVHPSGEKKVCHDKHGYGELKGAEDDGEPTIRRNQCWTAESSYLLTVFMIMTKNAR